MVSIARTNRRKAFTLIELLVVIAIISVLMAVAFPAIAVMSRLTRGGAGETTIGIAARTASAYAGKPKERRVNPLGGDDFISNGAAILFTPNGDIRILETDHYATDTAGNYLQTLSPPVYGFKDREIGINPADPSPRKLDYINLPDNTGVIGILRTGSGANGIKLITPPFAILFNANGQATTGFDAGDESQMVFYDGNEDTHFNTSTGQRNNGYNPEEWNPKSTDWLDTHWNASETAPLIPFDRIETVVGILIYQISDFNSGGQPARTLVATSGGYLDNNTQDWLLQTDADGKLVNAKAIFFSRNSGSILKGYR